MAKIILPLVIKKIVRLEEIEKKTFCKKFTNHIIKSMEFQPKYKLYNKY